MFVLPLALLLAPAEPATPRLPTPPVVLESGRPDVPPPPVVRPAPAPRPTPAAAEDVPPVDLAAGLDEPRPAVYSLDPRRPHLYLKGGGIFSLPHSSDLSTTGFDIDYNFGGGFYGGVGVEFGDAVKGRGEFEYARTSFSSDFGTDIDVDSFAFNALLVLDGREQFQPFFGVGTGVQRVNFSFGGNQSTGSAVELRAIAGASFFFSDRLSLDVTGRYNIGFQTTNRSDGSDSTPLDFVTIGVGLSFRF